MKVESGEEEQEEEEHEINEDGEKVLVKKSDGGPWNKTQQQEGKKLVRVFIKHKQGRKLLCFYFYFNKEGSGK